MTPGLLVYLKQNSFTSSYRHNVYPLFFDSRIICFRAALSHGILLKRCLCMAPVLR
uniref:Uncharacterized protein n=1 Tax=Anguilla anguilla TaxID=7936 RepID=A0A0E9XU25_ANGAN